MYKLSVLNKQRRNKLTVTNFSLSKDWIGVSPVSPSTLLMASFFSLFAVQAHAVTSFERLSALLAETPEGGWVKASTNSFSDAWPTGADAVQIDSYRFPGAIVNAWSSFAWDSARGNLMLWGGGHSNYAGNEMYVLDGATGKWGRGSLPSRIDSNGFVVGGGAPQSAHTYDNNIYLPVNDMFLTFGGPIFPRSGNFQTANGRAGPFLWDPTKADPNKVGGITGSGYNTTNVAEGGNMWIDRQGQWTGSEPLSYVNGTTAYQTENGKDVVYVSASVQASGFPSLYRYTLGDVRNGEQDKWEIIGISSNSLSYGGAATIDSAHNLYIKTATVSGRFTSDLMIWDLDNANAAQPSSNRDIGVNLINADGTDFQITRDYGIDYDTANNRIVLWDGADGGGTVWSASVITDAAGNIGPNTTWTVHEIPSSTVEHPSGGFSNMVLGKWHYDEALGAFIALDDLSQTSSGGWDAGVWLYKPMVAEIPEPETYALLLAGIGLIGWVARRKVA